MPTGNIHVDYKLPAELASRILAAALTVLPREMVVEALNGLRAGGENFDTVQVAKIVDLDDVRTKKTTMKWK